MADPHGSHAIDAHDNPEVRHESSDINIRGVFAFGASLYVTLVFVALFVWLTFRFFDARDRRASVPQFPLAASQAARVPPEPRLQTTPRQDLLDLRASEEQVLNSYGWVDKNAGVVRIPIDEAMKLTVQRGLASHK